tara:strand:+ start:749 stop:925 length:177 start_codon:yes stop_codon:yes gene_type:complete
MLSRGLLENFLPAWLLLNAILARILDAFIFRLELGESVDPIRLNRQVFDSSTHEALAS